MNALVQNHRRSFLLLLLLCLYGISWGQPRAAFTATPLSGCSPLVVYFSDSSSGVPTQWRWDLGNGVTSFLRNPSATYFNPGTYSVKLIVSNAKGADSVVKREYITVYASPVPDFSFDKNKGCFPLPVQFSDKSTPGSGSIVSRHWDFGDGTISTLANPVHTYTSAGNFSLTLRVTNSFGCVKSSTQPGVIQIADGVKAGFSTSDPGACPAPATAQFTNNSNGPGPLQYQWTFGDGATSNAANPAHTYNSNGVYAVSLIATSPQGCADTVRKDSLFRIGSARAGFTFPATICVNAAATFTNTSSPKPSDVQWDFGDATYSSQINPTKVYTKDGLVPVQMVASFGSCSDTVKKMIAVTAKPAADFSTPKQIYCQLPAHVQFTGKATGHHLTYAWDFGDSTTATTANPLHTYTKEGNYTVRLIVTNESGCSDTLIKKDFINVQKPRVQVQGLPKTGCAPITIRPTAIDSAGQTITSYLWSFGDGTTSTASAPAYTYTKAGNYDVSLIATTAAGCTDMIVYTRGVRTGEKPKADFIHQPQTVCSYDKVFFTDKSTGNVDQWYWIFGDGGTSREQNPSHQFGDTGWHHVTLVAYNNTCPDTVVVKNAVYVNPPISFFVVKNDCENKFTKQFIDKSLGAKTWQWEFGDGSTSGEQNPVHTYAATGTYDVKLTVTNGNCFHYTIKKVMVIDEKADFITPDTVICRNGMAGFTAIGFDSANIKNWRWDFGDGTGNHDTAKTVHQYTTAGSYIVTLTITDLLGCKSTKSRQLKVFGPTAAFSPAVAAACLKDNRISFNDASTSDSHNPIVKWIWNYGENKLDSVSVAPFQHHYDTAGTYNVALTVEDSHGCRDSMTRPAAVTIAQPFADFTVSDTLFCTGKVLSFTNASKGVEPVYAWSFGDGNTSAVDHPRHAFGATGVYSVKLTITDKYGCRDSVEKQKLITILYPKAAFTLSDSTGTCPPLLVHFTNQSTGYKSIVWDFGDGNTSRLDTPSHFYTTPGVFYATLIATSHGGCTDTVRKQIVVKGPTGTLRYSPLTGCKPLTVNFTATTKNNASFIWDFSDGATHATKNDTVSYTYTTAGEYVPKIILRDDGGCSVPIEGKDTIRVYGVATDFSMNAATFCDKGMVQFNNHSVSNDLITRYQWSFGDGSSSTERDPSHHYTKPGNYTTQLVVTTQNGCSDIKALTDTIKIYTSPVVQIDGDTAACAPATFTLRSTVKSGNASLLKWNWNMGNGQTANVANPTPQLYANDGSYAVTTIAIDEHGCSDTATKNVTVFPVPQTSANADVWICRGSFYQLKVIGAASYQWRTAPSLSCTKCDSPLAAPTDSTQYIVTGYNSFGCSRSDSITVRVHQPFKLNVAPGDTICAGKTIALSASGADQYTWMPSIGVKNSSAGFTTATPQTSTLYKVVAKDNVGCFTDTGSVYVKVWPIPTVKAETAQTLSIGNSLRLQPSYSDDVTRYQWSHAQTLSCADCPSPIAKPKTETKYTIQVTNDGGCTATETITVRVICNDGNLFIPNTFSPNGDGSNDRFYPRGTGISSIKSLKVFNRWGEMVFSRENFNANDGAAGWDGTYKGAVLSPDVYVYTCEVVCMNNEVLNYKGDVTLLR